MTRIVAIAAAIALAAAVLPWPYGYYQALRLGIFAAGIYCGFMMKSSGDDKLAYGLFFAALVFNPFLPVYLTRAIWLPIDLIGAALFAFTSYRQTITGGARQ
ncbi:hypothetical protein CO731_01264 [Aminobacter sp. MSH1]|uniref:DUF6804 family protein n=1 Tax=Aminobacter sp. MSH1 TaxID=374606 RepID=UPI000D3DA096|nr:DUF6804 family protein [Aminobacter sp. MSH1]AWC21811.1 hypothetical protein CO731_01264 [Aminobacter sp. MSH1]